ncbi:MAG: ATP-binding cassette domain-containing protein [Oscillospiraceae bacterium]|jgi:polar amino acid transport system ATP-binding protein|nr:ATP-binding cassette domain-containing protein [Oscillospiraceae bacterium]
MVDVVLETRDLIKAFGSVVVLNGINIQVRFGECVAICGPSGAGKSTFFRCLTLLETPTGGDIIFRGESLLAPGVDKQQIRQQMGVVSQQFNLFANLSVLENITIAPIKVLKKSPEEAAKEAVELLSTFELLDKATQYPHQLSGGQQQRVAISRALAMSPAVILFDEPTSALDYHLRNDVQKTIKDLHNRGITTIIITHDIDLAEGVATRILHMQEGKLV